MNLSIMEIFPDMRIYFAYSVNASLNLSLQIGNCQLENSDSTLTSALLVTYQCTMNMSIHEYFDNTSKPQQQHNLTVRKVNSCSSHTVGKGKEIRMDLNPNKISTRFRK